MNIFRRRKLQQVKKTSTEDLKVVLKTEKDFSDEEMEAISITVKNGVISGMSNSDIGIMLIMRFGLSDMVILNRMKDGIEVII